MIQIKNITKKYDDTVLNQVSYTFEKNKIYVIKGVSGCGKSTLLNILGGLESDYEGEYLFEDKDVKSLSKQQREDMRQTFGYIFQSSLLMSNLTVMENLLFICNDRESIEKYAEQLNVTKLLNKYPEQLSGGERQRISVIRAMILNPTVILADEPTASLDKSNSMEIASLFETLRGENRVIIVATHENCFDDVADEVIHLDYGVIGEIQRRNQGQEKVEAMTNISSENNKCNNSLTMLLNLIFKRQRKKFRFISMLPMILVIFAVLVCCSVQHNFYAECVKYCMKQYPMEVIPIDTNIYDMTLSQEYDNTEKFDLYTIEEESFSCYPLLSEEDSVLAYGGLVKYGTFPKKETDVLVSYRMASMLYDEEHIEDCIGESISIKDNKYIITGVVADIENDYSIDREIYYGDIYYTEIANASIVYMPYQTIRQYGELQETNYYMVKVNGLYDDEEFYQYVKESIMGGIISEWDSKLMQMKNMADYVNKIIFATFLLAAFMGVMFIKNDIEVDLFYRRRELGYMQIFGVKKKTMWLQLILERLVKNFVCLVISIVLFNVIGISVKLIMGVDTFVTIMHLLIVLVAVLGFSFVSVVFPIRKFLKKSVLTLITE